MSEPIPFGRERSPPRFTTGSILRHILVMTGTGAIGLMAIFLGDFANILFLSQLNDVEVVAAVGYASSLVFMATSVGIGLAIAITAVVSPAIGGGRRSDARRLAAHGLLYTLAVSAVLSAVLVLALPMLLSWLGATGRTHTLATGYGRIVIAALPPLAVGMAAAAVLRSVGDANRAMHVTLAGAVVNVALDPLLIFGFGLGLDGAAIASAVSRFAVMAVGLYGVLRVHDLIARPELAGMSRDAATIAAVAVPAIVSNLATPFANAYVTSAISSHGDASVAGWTVIGRVIPVAFGAIFALSSSIGPIIGQNLGARNAARMAETVRKALVVTAVFTLVAWLALAVSAAPLVRLFDANGEAAALIVLFCRGLAPLFFFLGALFVSNAVFNTLGRPHVATAMNWGRATLGTIPLVHLGSWLGGAPGALTGFMASGIVFGIVAVVLSLRLVQSRAAEWRESGRGLP